MIAQNSPFYKFWMLGYRGLVPIVPPDAQLSPRSTLFKRLEAGKDARGKAVGIKGHDGLWRGFDWLRAPDTTKEDIRAWSEMGAGVGIRTGNGLVALDIDSLDPEIVAQAAERAELTLGVAPIRVGRAPKALLVYRTEEPIGYMRVEFTGFEGRNERIELLSDDRQFVAHGIHPGTGKPYEWTRHIDDLPSYGELPIVTATQVKAYFAELASILPAAQIATSSLSSVDRATIDQSTLIGDLKHVTRAVEALPNTAVLYPTYDDYVRVGAAIKGATQAAPDAGLQLFQQWASRFDGDAADPETAAADYARIKAPFELGASWLYDQAEKHSTPGTFSKADVWFDELTQTDNPFALDAKASTGSQPIEPLKLIAPLDWEGVEPKSREWEVEGWIPKGEVTLLYGDGGIGKTLLIHQYATAAAAGIDWLGQPTRQARVLCFFCEDSEDELHRRQQDINASLMLTYGEINDNLRIAPRKFMDNAFAHWDRNTGALRMQAIWTALRNAAVEFKADVVVVDTIADVFAGSEIDRVQVNSFVKACLGKLATEINGTVIALGHPSMSGKASGQGTSGSTAWSNAARSRLFLRYPKGTEKGNVRELEGMKSNYGPKGNLLKLRWNKGAFDAISGSILMNSETVQEGHIPILSDAVSNLVLATLELHPAESLSLSERANNFAPRILKRLEPELFDAYSTSDIEDAMRAMERAGTIEAVQVGKRPDRKVVMGYAPVRIESATGGDNMSVLEDIASATASVFD
jgi:archaellum biogenesis ATPase FlaH